MFETNHFFVYGTLKRGQLREHSWPHPPVSVVAATAIGELHDLGDYPAMIPGNGVVSGELWTFEDVDVGATIAVLDEIEGYDESPDDLYRRVIISVTKEGGSTALAHAYHYARELSQDTRLKPQAGVSVWDA